VAIIQRLAVKKPGRERGQIFGGQAIRSEEGRDAHPAVLLIQRGYAILGIKAGEEQVLGSWWCGAPKACRPDAAQCLDRLAVLGGDEQLAPLRQSVPAKLQTYAWDVAGTGTAPLGSCRRSHPRLHMQLGCLGDASERTQMGRGGGGDWAGRVHATAPCGKSQQGSGGIEWGTRSAGCGCPGWGTPPSWTSVL
jgi:hypothetical protein